MTGERSCVGGGQSSPKEFIYHAERKHTHGDPFMGRIMLEWLFFFTIFKVI